MKHGLWLATLGLAGCCCLRPHPAPPTETAATEPAAAVVDEPAATAQVAAATLESAVAAVPAPPDPPLAQPPRPPQTEHGQWTIVVVSERKERDTQAWTKRLGDAGFKVAIVPVQIGDTVWYRVVLPGYRAQGEARAAVPLANEAAGVNDAFIWRRPQEPAAN